MPCSLAREPPLQAPRLRLPLCLRGLLGAGFPSRSRLSFQVCSPAERLHLPEPVSQHPTACPLVAVGSAGWPWSFTRHSVLRLQGGSIGRWRFQARSRRSTWCGRTGRSSGQALLAGVRVLGAADGQEARGGLGRVWPCLPCRAQPSTMSAGSLWARPARDPPCHTLGCSVSFQTVANCVQLVSLLEFMY